MIREGTRVTWPWGNGRGEGEVIESSTDRIERTIKGTSVVREGSQGDKALLIRTDDGDLVVKSESECTRADASE